MGGTSSSLEAILSTKSLDLVTPEEIWKESLLAKSKYCIPREVWEHLNQCGREQLFRTCKSCGHWDALAYRCNLKFCPVCNWRISRERSQLLRLWSLRIGQPKHIVLTMRNFSVLTRSKIRKFQRAFAKLRRSKLFAQCKGGCISTEITNEGRGWHLHAHILADVRFIDAGPLAIMWGRLVGQEFGIVRVKDVRGQEYCHEVCKYVVKGSELVTWQPEEINEFIQAVSKIRMFTTFGSLFKIRRQIRYELEELKPEAKTCTCGCQDWRFETEAQVITGEIRARERQ